MTRTASGKSSSAVLRLTSKKRRAGGFVPTSRKRASWGLTAMSNFMGLSCAAMEKRSTISPPFMLTLSMPNREQSALRWAISMRFITGRLGSPKRSISSSMRSSRPAWSRMEAIFLYISTRMTSLGTYSCGR